VAKAHVVPQVESTRPLRGLGVSTHFERRDLGWKAEALIPMVRRMGATVVRQEIAWATVETERGHFRVPDVARDWLQRAWDAELGVIVTLFAGNKVHENPLDPAAFTRYAEFMAKEFRGKPVVAYEIWNEPTNFEIMQAYGGPWSGQAPCPWLDRYAELTALAAPAIKAADPRAKVIINPGEVQFGHMVKDHPESLAAVDGISHHPYCARFPPETVPWGGPQIRQRDGLDTADGDHSALSMWRITQEWCRKHLGRELDLYATEYGYPTYNAARKPAHAAGFKEPAQAAYLARGVVLALVAGLKSICLYDFMDDGLDIYEAEDNFGLIHNEKRGWEPKPAYDALRRLADCLGPDWQYVADAPLRLDVPMKPLPQNQDLWQAPVVEPHLRITAPQVFSFRTGSDFATILWRGGRINSEYNDPLGDLIWTDTGRTVHVASAEDLVTGQALTVRIEGHDGQARLPDLPVGGNPVAVRWRQPG